MSIAIYPGTFDPVTCGHLDIIERSAKLFDQLIVAVAINVEKTPLFNLSERLEMLKEVCKDLNNVEVESFSGLLVDYANEKGAQVIVKGLRAISDFEFEFQMALMNKKLNPNVETIFIMTATEHSYLSSSIVKEIASLGGSVYGLVPPCVEIKLRKKFGKGGEGD